MPNKTTIVVKCSCGANLRVPASAAGKRIRCPKCKEPLRVKARTPRPATAIPPAAPVEDDLLGSFGESESSAASMESHRSPFDKDAIRCNQCGAKMQAEARLCTACGFDAVTGKMLSGATAASSGAKAASSVAEAGKAAAGSAGRFLLGTFLSVVGAGIGGVIWLAIRYYTGYEVGYVAIGVGILAGLGMAVGYRESNRKAGVVASVLAVLGIIGAKFAVVAVFIATMSIGDASGTEFQRGFVKSFLVEEILDDRGLETDEQREAQRDSALEEAAARTAEMGPDEIQARWEAYRDLLKEGADESSQDMFDLLDLLFIILAVGAAYRTATGLSRDSE